MPSFLEDHYNRQQSRYEERLLQTRITFYVSLFLIIVGVLIIFVGVYLLIIHSPSGGIATGAGFISGTLGGIIFRLNNNVNKRLDQTAQELQSLAGHIDGCHQAEDIINKISNASKKDNELATLAKNIQRGPPKVNRDSRASPRSQTSSGIIYRIFRRIFP